MASLPSVLERDPMRHVTAKSKSMSGFSQLMLVFAIVMVFAVTLATRDGNQQKLWAGHNKANTAAFEQRLVYSQRTRDQDWLIVFEQQLKLMQGTLENAPGDQYTTGGYSAVLPHYTKLRLEYLAAIKTGDFTNPKNIPEGFRPLRTDFTDFKPLTKEATR